MARLKTKSIKLHWLVKTSATLRQTALVVAIALVYCATAAAQNAAATSQDESIFEMLFSGYTIAVVLVLGLVGLVVYKKTKGRRGGWETVEEEEPESAKRPQRKEPTAPKNATMPAHQEVTQPAHWDGPPPSHESASVFGAYRVDQEVWKLVFGKAHRTDVLASRSSDDRRAIESSLIKALTSPDADATGQNRARQALEEYGFLARQSAILLLGRDAWERTSAARMMGQIGSASSLPFLIEALHDSDVVVRNQAVSSLGELKLPAAIGALLDVARRHPEIPAPLLSEALSSCSVDTLAFLDFPSSEPGFSQESTPAEQEAEHSGFTPFDNLPETDTDPAFAEVLSQAKSEDNSLRAQAAQMLGTYSVQQSVTALAALATDDTDDGIRAAAVASLGSIDHESVFGPILIALADESREVRAAAARALNSVRFDRGDGYVRAMEASDAKTLQSVARACVTIGIVAQAVDRLVSEDRRQAYEAFSLFSLLARANETEPILEVIDTHVDENVRLCAVRVLNVAAQPEVAPRLRELVASESISEAVRTATLEVLYRLDQGLSASGLAADDNITSDVA